MKAVPSDLLGRRIVRKPKNDQKKRLSRVQVTREIRHETWFERIAANDIYPMNAPGIPLPGPNFQAYLRHLGDEEFKIEKVKIDDPTKKSGKKQVDKLVKASQEMHELHRRALREPGFQLPIELTGGRMQPVTFVTGHIWGEHLREYVKSISDPDASFAPMVTGPHPADVMVIGKMPGKEDVDALRNMMGQTADVLIRCLNELKIRSTPKWYVTNLVKFRPPDGSSTIKAAWLRDCLPLLHQELRIVRPKYILCLGADASKALLGDKFNVSYMDGRVIDYTYDIGLSETKPLKHTARVMSVVNPGQVLREPSSERQLFRGMARFNLLQSGINFDKEETDIQHRRVDTLEDLEALLYEIEYHPDKKDNVLAVDAEWHGEHPVNKGSYVRTIQFAWLPKHAAAVVLKGAGGKNTFTDLSGRPAGKRAIKLLSAFFRGQTYNGRTFRRKRVVGHFFNADLEWLVDLGLDIRECFQVPLYDLDLKAEDVSIPKSLRKTYRKLGFKRHVPAWVRAKYEGGADTGLMAHAIEETAKYGLEVLALRYTTAPRYDVPLDDWRDAYCKEHNLKSSALEGYGMCPDEILVPYGIYDADVTLRLYYEFTQLLDCDYDGNCCWEPFWESMIAAPAVLEIHQNGIQVDRRRIDFLTEKFLVARDKVERKIQKWAAWDEKDNTFNIRSVQHVKEFLFGAKFNGRYTKDGQNVRIRPPQAKSLHLTPIFDTSKPPKPWSEIIKAGKEREHSPSTNKIALSLLAQDNLREAEQINWIRDQRFLDQVLKTVLRPPVEDDDGNWEYEQVEAYGDVLVYDAGLASVICDDGRVRTHIYQTKETGRWSSARPNLQNISKQRDDDYKRLLGAVRNERNQWVGGDYKYPLRSILRASPGHLLIEADYVGAELYGMAIMSGDRAMIDHATRNQLPEDHPDYYDIHSNVAVLAFQLRCPPTKKGLDSIGKSKLRIVAKSVIFGIAYGRGAKAIALAAKEQGISITEDQARTIIDTIFTMYPGLKPFFDECTSRVAEDRWLCHCFGRFRRFPQAYDQKTLAEFQRQAMNFPIQGMIASAVSRAMAYLYDFKKDQPDMFRILLQIHDAILIEAPYRHVEYVAEKVLPWAMRDMISIYPTRLDGTPTGAGPFKLGFEAEVMRHWGEKLKVESAEKYHLNPEKKKFSKEGVVVKYLS